MNAKKLISLVLALVMMLALSTSAMAASITINTSETGHVYEAYQIFSGDISDGKLVNIAWSNSLHYHSGNILSALIADETIGNKFNKTMTAEDVAKAISADDFNTNMLDIFAKIVGNYLEEKNIAATRTTDVPHSTGGYVIASLAEGYYLVKDKNDTTVNDYTKYILQVLGEEKIEPKVEAPELEKKIVEDETEKDASTADIGDTVEYKLESKVPDMDLYNKYFFIIHDTLSNGLTFDSTSVRVTLGNITLTNSTDYDVVTTGLSDGCTFEIVFKNFIQHKEKKGDAIVVTYSAIIDEDALVGTIGNTNTANLEYSNNPYEEYQGAQENPDRPGPNEPTGETPDDTVVTYTTEIKLTKVEKGNVTKTLTGAKFSIAGFSSKVRVINSEMFVEDANGTYYRLKNGTYTTAAPVDADDESTPDVNEKNIDSYDDPTKKYAKVETVTKGNVETEFVTDGWVNDQGVLTFTGLGEGTYTITEIVAPEGYNLLKDPITVTVTSNAANITEPTAVTTVTWTATGNPDDENSNWTVNGGKIEITVENSTGSELPETGGMGTTMIYIAGGLLVAAAVVLMVTKRRMGAAE